MLGVLSVVAVGQDNNFDQFTDPPKTPEARPAENVALNAAYSLEPAPYSITNQWVAVVLSSLTVYTPEPSASSRGVLRWPSGSKG